MSLPMNVYVMLPTTHLDQLKLSKLKRALRRFTTQPVIRTGLEFWIADHHDKEAAITGIAALCACRKDLTALLDICLEACIGPHLAATSDAPPVQYFSNIDARQAYDRLEEAATKGTV